jgi:hypothetical protein
LDRHLAQVIGFEFGVDRRGRKRPQFQQAGYFSGLPSGMPCFFGISRSIFRISLFGFQVTRVPRTDGNKFMTNNVVEKISEWIDGVKIPVVCEASFCTFGDCALPDVSERGTA